MGDPKAAELAQEQAYFDAAAVQRARRLDALSDLSAAAANKGAAAYLGNYAARAAAEVGAAGDAVAVGRIDDESDWPLYVGRQLIRDDRYEVLVVNWHAPAAAPYFKANAADPQGLRRKRVFT